MVHQDPRRLDGPSRPVKEWLRVPTSDRRLLHQVPDLYSDSRLNGAVCRQGIGQARVSAIRMSYSSYQ